MSKNERKSFTRLQKLLGSDVSSSELNTLILQAAAHVCSRIGDPAAANTLRQVQELYSELERSPQRRCLHCYKLIPRGFEVPSALGGFAHRACEEAKP